MSRARCDRHYAARAVTRLGDASLTKTYMHDHAQGEGGWR
jgi:hypothetical protein